MHPLYARFNTGLLVFIALIGIVLVTMMATRAYGGPLDPPGPAASTMKTLQQVEPRTPIAQPANAAGFPIQIDAAGSYYLTGNIAGVAGKDGVVISADNVTLDLNGFTLSGAINDATGIDTNGIKGNGATVTIRNGIIRDWKRGLYAPDSIGGTFEDLNVTENIGTGMLIGSSSNARRLFVRSNFGTGLEIDQTSDTGSSVVEDSTIDNNGKEGILIAANGVWAHHNVVDANGTDGVFVPEIWDNNEITDNRITKNASYGLELNGNGNVVLRNTVDANIGGQLVDTGVGNIIGPLQQSPSTDPNANIGHP